MGLLNSKQLRSRLKKLRERVRIETRARKRVEDKIKKLGHEVKKREHDLKEAIKRAKKKK